jgi:tRNA (adenine22-N1)-methyltransferase
LKRRAALTDGHPAPLSARLETALELLSPCRVLIDVGTDHGLVPIAAVERDIAQRAIAADLRRAPLRLAQQNVTAAAVGERVALLRADGLSGLARRAVDAVIMAGMSGEQMVRLCSTSPHALEGVAQLVLQPNSDAAVVRSWARTHGWHLHDERMVYERGQFFVLCAFRPGTGDDASYDVPAWSPSALCLVGPLLLARKDPTSRRFFEWQCGRLAALVEQHVHTLEPELAIWRAAYAFAASE